MQGATLAGLVHGRLGSGTHILHQKLLSEIQLDGPMQRIASDMTAFYVKDVFTS